MVVEAADMPSVAGPEMGSIVPETSHQCAKGVFMRAKFHCYMRNTTTWNCFEQRGITTSLRMTLETRLLPSYTFYYLRLFRLPGLQPSRLTSTRVLR